MKGRREGRPTHGWQIGCAPAMMRGVLSSRTASTSSTNPVFVAAPRGFVAEV
jgi:hypothetical protein